MRTADMAKPATALRDEPALDLEHLGGRLGDLHTSHHSDLQLRAELVGSDKAIAGDIMASGALDLYPRLLTAGANPAAEFAALLAAHGGV